MDIKYMELAVTMAKKAYNKGEVPVGCVIVHNGKVIAKSYNKRERLQNSLYHAEILAINKACKKLKSWRLDECDIYVTLEPCQMCSGAIIQSKIKNIYYGASDFKTGACGGRLNLFDMKFNYSPNIVGGILEDDSKKLIQNFFKKLRVK